MHSSIILSTLLAGASLVSAAVLPRAPIVPRNLTEDDVLLWSADGRMEIMNKTQFAELSSPSSPAFNVTTSQPISVNTTSIKTNGARNLEKRCNSYDIYTMYPVQTFLNWDVPMSAVVLANGDSTSIAVAQGYTIGNTLQVGASVSASVEGFLTETYSINWSETWTSSYTSTISYTVPAGKYAAIVSNPYTTRYTGRVDVGCIGEPTDSSEYQADVYTSKSYGGLDWVDGIISLCTGDSYPLQKCIGEGTN